MKKRNTYRIIYILLICFTGIYATAYAGDNGKKVSVKMDESKFVNITDVVPDVILEIRYFGTYNFVGARIDGYMQPVALLTKEAADSLKAVR